MDYSPEFLERCRVYCNWRKKDIRINERNLMQHFFFLLAIKRIWRKNENCATKNDRPSLKLFQLTSHLKVFLDARAEKKGNPFKIEGKQLRQRESDRFKTKSRYSGIAFVRTLSTDHVTDLRNSRSRRAIETI